MEHEKHFNISRRRGVVMGLDRAKTEMLRSAELHEEGMRCEYRYICIAKL